MRLIGLEQKTSDFSFPLPELAAGTQKYVVSPVSPQEEGVDVKHRMTKRVQRKVQKTWQSSEMRDDGDSTGMMTRFRMVK